MITKEVDIDINEPQSSACWTVQQNEYNSRSLKFSITKDRMPYDIPSQAVVVLKFVKPDGTYVVKKCDYNGSTVVVPIDRQMSCINGIAIGKMSIIYVPDPTIDPYQLLETATYVLDTVQFRLNIDKDIIDETYIISSDEYTFFQEVIDKVVDWIAPYIDTDTNEWIVDGKHTGVIASGGSGGSTVNSKMYSVRTTSNNGNIFKNKIIDTTLSCSVYSWDEDISDVIVDNSFIWTRKTDDTNSDELWNFEHQNEAKEINITSDDCSNDKTIFTCAVTMTNGVVLSGNIEIQNINETISIESIICQYGVSNSLDIKPTTWEFDIPTYLKGQYLWIRDYITYTNGATSTTGERLSNSSESIVITSFSMEYYKSSSSTVLSDGFWSENTQSWEKGKYLWTRTKILYSNNTTEYTTPICDSTWLALKTLNSEINNQITTIVETQKGTTSAVNALEQKIIDKVWSTDITTAINDYDGTTVKTIRDDVTQVTTDLSGVKTDITSLNTKVESKADGSTITALDTKVNSIESTANVNKSTISELQGTVENKADGSTVSELTTKVSTLEQDSTKFKQTVSETYATKGSVTEIDGKLSNDYSTTTQMNSAIEQSASSITSTVKGYTDDTVGNLEKRVKDNETNISQNATDITLRATRTEVENAKTDAINTSSNDATNKADKALSDSKTFTISQGYLTVSSEEIKSMVSKTQTAQNTADTAQNTIDNINIGVRNLFPIELFFNERDILFTQDEAGVYTISNDILSSDSNEYRIYSVPFELNNIEGTYTMSANAIHGSSNIYIQILDSNSNVLYSFYATTYSFLVMDLPSNCQLRFNWDKTNLDDILNTDIVIDKFKIESGNKPTEWIEAIEDAYTQFSEISQTVNNIESTVSSVEQDVKRAKMLSLILSNTYQSVPTDSDGLNGNFIGCNTTATVYYGNTDVSSSTTYTISTSAGVIGSWDITTRKFIISGLSLDNGYVDITATYTSNVDNITLSVTRRFSVSKNKQGLQGDIGKSATTYYLESLPNVLQIDSQGTYMPQSLSLSSWSLNGDSTSRKEYAGRIVIDESIDGNTYNHVYMSESDISEYLYTPSNNKLKFVKCSLYAYGDTQYQYPLDTISIPIVINAEKELEIMKTTQIQDSNGWKMQLAKIGAYNGSDVEEVVTSLSLDESGVTVTQSESSGHKTVITGDEFAGYVNDGFGYEKIFSVNEETVETKKVVTENGVTFDKIDLTAMTLHYGDTAIGGAVFVKSVKRNN